MDNGGKPKSLRQIAGELNHERSRPSRDGETPRELSEDKSSSQSHQGEGAGEPDRGHTTPQLVLRSIGERFTSKRKSDRIGAYKQLQEDLMNNAHNLIPFVVSLKEVLGTTIDIEDFLKGSESNTGRSPVEEIKAFLTTTSATMPKGKIN